MITHEFQEFQVLLAVDYDSNTNTLLKVDIHKRKITLSPIYMQSTSLYQNTTALLRSERLFPLQSVTDLIKNSVGGRGTG